MIIDLSHLIRARPDALARLARSLGVALPPRHVAAWQRRAARRVEAALARDEADAMWAFIKSTETGT